MNIGISLIIKYDDKGSAEGAYTAGSPNLIVVFLAVQTVSFRKQFLNK